MHDANRLASEEEVAIALAALSTADFIRLGRIAQLRARGLPEIDWRDLLQEATERALEGARRWPLDVPFLVFLAETMRSIASEAWRRRSRQPSLLASRDDAEESAVATAVDPTPDPERVVVARDLLAHLRRAFEDDAQALSVLEGLAEGLPPLEIQARYGFEPKTYDSVRRRMRRKIARIGAEMH